MVQADDYLLTELIPLFKPASVAAALTLLQQLGEENIVLSSSSSSSSTIYSCATGDCRSSRTQFMLSVLVALRKRVAHSSRHLIKKWCDRTASRAAIEIQLQSEELRIKKQYELDDDDNGGSENVSQKPQLVGNDITGDDGDVIEVPCLLLLCSFAVTFLGGIASTKRRNELFSTAVIVAQSGADLIVRDDVTLEEVIEFGLDVAATPRWRWLLPQSDTNSLLSDHQFPTPLALKINALLWSLTNSSKKRNTTTGISSSSSSSSSAMAAVVADPHLLLWSKYSTTSIPDAVVLESSEEARTVLEEDDQQHQCEKLLSSSSSFSKTTIATGVIILLVADRKDWTFDSLLFTCKKLVAQEQSFSIWVDNHECLDLFQSLSRVGQFSMLQWFDGDEEEISPGCNGDENDQSFARKWLNQALSCPSFPAPIADEHKKQNVISAALACMTALEDACTTICSDELAKSICGRCTTSSSLSPKNSGKKTTCTLSLLSYVAARLPDIVPSYSQSTLGGRFISPQEKKLASRRAGSLSSLPPGISMAPDVLYVYRLAEQLPSDYFAAFWVSLLLNHYVANKRRTMTTMTKVEHDQTIVSSWTVDTSIVKMNSQWNAFVSPPSSVNSSGSATSTTTGKISQPSSTTTLTNSTSMCKAFSFVLTSWCEEKVDGKTEQEQQEEELEEAVGRLKSVADVIDRHQTVEVRAFQQTVTASRAELRSILDDAAQLLRTGGMHHRRQQESSSSSSHDQNNSNLNSSCFFSTAEESFKARKLLFASWTETSSFAKRNYRAAMIVLQQVARVFDREAKRVAGKLKISSSASSSSTNHQEHVEDEEVKPMIILRFRSELEKVASYFDQAMSTAVKALGVKGKPLLYGSDELQRNMKIIRGAL